MKPYEKPRLVAISLSANDRLCGDCVSQGGVALAGNEMFAQQILIAAGRFDLIADGVDKSDFNSFFGSGEDCMNELESYCKFSSNNGQVVAWS